MEEVDSFSSIEASVSEFGEIITAKKNSHRFEEYVNKACQANFGKLTLRIVTEVVAWFYRIKS